VRAGSMTRWPGPRWSLHKSVATGTKCCGHPIFLICSVVLNPSCPCQSSLPRASSPSRGSVVLRDGWKEDQTVFSLRAGPWMNHEHHDQGSFQLASQGELLVGEGGYADYYRDPNYKDYFSEAPDHNVVTIDGDPFSQLPYDGIYYKALAQYTRLSSSLLTNRVDYLEADLQPAYGDALQRYRRTILYLKPGLLVIGDDLEARSPHAFHWLLHPASGAEIVQEGQGMKIEGSGRHAAVALVAVDEKLSWQVSPAPIPINDFTDLDRTPVSNRHVLALVSPSSLQTRFLVGLSVGAATELSFMERYSTLVGDGFMQKRPDQQTIVLFRNHAGSLAAFDATADSDILAVTKAQSGDVEQVFVGHARALRLEQFPGFSLSTPGNFVVELTQGDALLTIDVEKLCGLHFDGSLAKSSVKMDDKPEPGVAGNQRSLSNPANTAFASLCHNSTLN
jgi:hypothetical protein